MAPDQSSLLTLLKRNRERTLVEWEQAVRELPPARGLDVRALRDHIPALLDGMIDAAGGRPIAAVEELSEEHARDRLDQGFSLEHIAQEYRVLRSVLLRLAAGERVPLESESVVQLNEAIDQAIVRALTRYHESRSRTLMALERISQEAFAAPEESLRDFLRRLLAIVLDTTEAVDTAVMYLREWDRIVLRAAAGIEASQEDQVSMRIGEGIAGMVASTRRPYFTSDAARDPSTRNPGLVKAGVKALYAVPLVYGDQLIGVAKMGSRTAAEFNDDDRRLLSDMAQRAAVVIAHRRLIEERDLFLGVLGHDLRTPLSTITMGADHLRRREQLSPTGDRVLQRITAAAQRMSSMVGSLADFTKMRFGSGFTIDPHVMDLGDAVRALVGELAAQHPDRPLVLDARGDLLGEWDRVRLGQVLTNLVNNAVNYGQAGSRISIELDGSREAQVTLVVHNEGPPIQPGLLPHLFEAFRRGRSQRSGMGLGLYIVQHVVQAHGGEVTVESTAEHGTTFTVRVPRWAPAAAHDQNASPAEK